MVNEKTVLKTPLVIAAALILCTSCLRKSDIPKTDEPVDISEVAWDRIKNEKDFWVLETYLNTFPRSKHFDEALEKHITEREIEYERDGYPIVHCWKNCLEVRLIGDSLLLVDGEPTNIERLKQIVYNFLLNPTNDPNLSETEEVVDEEGKARKLSKAHFVIEFNRHQAEVQPVLIEMADGVQLYREWLALKWFGQEFSNLDEDKEVYLISILNNRIKFWDFEKEYENPPPLSRKMKRNH